MGLLVRQGAQVNRVGSAPRNRKDVESLVREREKTWGRGIKLVLLYSWGSGCRSVDGADETIEPIGDEANTTAELKGERLEEA
jgi:hypothetical protein